MTNKRKLIALVMEKVDAEFFASQLKPHAPDTGFVHLTSVAELEAVSKRDDLSLRLISFCSSLIIPGSVIERLSFNCFNFHPGPPERPGYMPAPFAFHERASDYGVTFHFMMPKVDTGAIIAVNRFALAPGDDVEAIELKAYKSLLAMVLDYAGLLADTTHVFSACGAQWSGRPTTKKDMAALHLFGNGGEALNEKR